VEITTLFPPLLTLVKVEKVVEVELEWVEALQVALVAQVLLF
jgi:hypothetical protein